MSHSSAYHVEAWLTTDRYGEIRSCSRAARNLLGISRPGRHNLLWLFPGHGKALMFDIQLALTGRPTQRVLPLRRRVATDSGVRYMVARRLDEEGRQLFWTFATLPSQDVPRCA